MEVPELVRSALDGEAPEARVELGGDDALFVAPSRTVAYRAEGLLSDEAVEEYSHDAERVSVDEGRRKATLRLDYGLDGERTLQLPSKGVDDALHHVLSGVLRTTGVAAPDEEIIRTFRFSELTLVVTDRRVVKHIGEPVWDQDYETFDYEDVVDLGVESGNVATTLVLTAADRRDRFKAPNEEARAVRESLEAALLSYHGVDSVEELRRRAAPEEEDADAAGGGEEVDFGDGPDPLGADPVDPESDAPVGGATGDPMGTESRGGDAEAGTAGDDGGEGGSGGERGSGGGEPPVEEIAAGGGTTRGGTGEGGAAGNDAEPAGDDGGERIDSDAFEGSGFRSAGPVDDPRLAEQLAALREAVETQNDELRRQRETIERLIEELRRGQ